MSHTSIILSGLMMMAMVAIIAPNILMFNRGRILRNIAIWLAVFTGLGLIYQNFGPESAHPLFEMPGSMANMRARVPAENSTPISTDGTSKQTGDQDFTPPKE